MMQAVDDLSKLANRREVFDGSAGDMEAVVGQRHWHRHRQGIDGPRASAMQNGRHGDRCQGCGKTQPTTKRFDGPLPTVWPLAP